MFHLISGNGEANVFVYEFSARPAMSKKPDYIIADHGDDIFFTFALSSLDAFMEAKATYETSDDNKKVENMMTQYISSFTKSGYVPSGKINQEVCGKLRR